MSEAHESVGTRVVEAIAEAAGTDPFSLEPPLYYSIDMEALERLFRPGTEGQVSFEYSGHHVVVGSDGTVTVDGITDEPR
ncbi:HalOD1 output domain-containing protein [Natronobiforma cellulositropha]|uniref:HalOD1 output domain-containing protein n=1 Tax=Natronobiforma cellulositropha TaxID=1679076 RepID=UPI0021D5F066|nr:HalOD1 output domain-containing protein [Natronobiforma cellulositropha]